MTVDGEGRHAYANRPRPDVVAVYPAFGPNHGFDVVVAPPPGQHTICVTASNVSSGHHKPLGCVTVESRRADPLGNIDSVGADPGAIAVAGWAIDPDSEEPIYVWVTVDGFGQHLYANKNRPDVGAAFPTFGPNHGFSGTLSAAPGPHRVCVTASNVQYGRHTRLGCRAVTVTDPYAPIGNYEHAHPWLLMLDFGSSVGQGVTVQGWAIDPNTADPIYVWVTVDGVGRHLYASKNRPDVGAAFPASGPDHGFQGDIEADFGWHTVCITASNVGPGQHTSLGCRTAYVPGWG